MSYVQLLAVFAFGFTVAIVFELVLTQTHRYILDRRLTKHQQLRKVIVTELLDMGYCLPENPWAEPGANWRSHEVWQVDPDTGAITTERGGHWQQDPETGYPTYVRPVKDPAQEWLDDLQKQQSSPQKYNGADWL